MNEVFICDAVRTPIGKYGGSLSGVRADDMAAIVIRALVERNPGLDLSMVDDVMIGCANQAGEDNRNVARMALLLAGLPETVPGVTINRLCGSGLDAVGTAARAIRAKEADLILAGGVESMSRAPFVIEKSTDPFSRNIKLYDTTMGWRFVNKLLEQQYGAESMIETAENIANDFGISREAQDDFAFLSQEKAYAAQQLNFFKDEIIPVSIAQRKGDQLIVSADEHPRRTSLSQLAALKPVVGSKGTVTAGNASGINDGASALLIASEAAVIKYNLTPLARFIGMAVAGVQPRIMGMGPVPATYKLLHRLKLTLDYFDIIEINEAFAAQVIGCIREFGLSADEQRINRWGGAIALGHPLGMSGARLVTTACNQLRRLDLRTALCTMCIGVGQGIAVAFETVKQSNS